LYLAIASELSNHRISAFRITFEGTGKYLSGITFLGVSKYSLRLIAYYSSTTTSVGSCFSSSFGSFGASSSLSDDSESVYSIFS